MSRDLSLSKRTEESRDKRPSAVINFELDEIKNHFDENIMDIENQFEIIDKLDAEVDKEKIDCILRSQIVFLGSSLDFYFHEITKFGLMKIYDGIWEETTKYKNIEVKMSIVSEALRERESSEWFINFINKKYIEVTMMSWDSINSQLNLIGLNVQNIAKEAFFERDSSEKVKDKLKRRIGELYNRRNSIAHQFDRLHSDATRIEISKEIVVGFIEDIKKIVYAIHKDAKNKD